DHTITIKITGDHLKMLASTVQFSTNTQPQPPAMTTHHHGGRITTSHDRTKKTTTPHQGRGHSLRTQQGVHRHHQHQPTRVATSHASPASPPRKAPPPHHRGHRALHKKALLRKEVIQPHLPVRLPCYDFVPIASPTFDGSLPQRVRPPASGVADFRDVTGGVYKARERIHRSVADLRLLATPTSRGRVADPDPN